MTSINHEVRQYLAFFIETVQKDISNLLLIASNGENEYLEGVRNGLYDRNQLKTTLNPDTTIFYTYGEQPSRCSIPLAMTCLSSIEILGSLINPTGYRRDFYNSAKLFFDYASTPISDNELKLLRSIYRNGLMHGFFPKGQKIGITYDSSLDSRTELFYIESDHVILNVNRLCSITQDVFTKIFTDNLVHTAIDKNLTDFIVINDEDSKREIGIFKSNHEE
ncbi:hypothetical protein PbJCM13498_03910 [Prolixibacter bellariivorans]|uniref:Uncharacterized protein n=1 Tax=Prolixibacter bellariivorans TaxID=314319 RepID=A0A5M4AV97_9BACT|nr:hypothetical protein [Prolixibacter bellariivorans]GET31528.1 hypothetical protein PbJCM13498_03910 [Prolixibacter bellariivorans]